jgi:hypothetical protein
LLIPRPKGALGQSTINNQQFPDMSDPSLMIRVGSTADTRGLTELNAKLTESEAHAREFYNTLKLGVGIDLGGKIVESIREIPDLLREATARGLEYNRTMQDSTIAIAGALRSVDSSLSFANAKEKGAETIEALRQKALALGIDFHSLIETFSVNVPTMWHAGIRDTQKMIDLITLLNQTARAKGIDGFQAQRDIIDILNGMGQRTLLGKELEANGVTNEAIARAKEQGNLYELLSHALAAYAEAGAAASNTQSAALTRLKTEWDSLLGVITKPLFDSLTEGINNLSAALDSPEGKQGLKDLGLEIRDVATGAMGLAEWAVKNSSALTRWAEAGGVLAIALAALKITEMVAGMGSLALRIATNTTLWATDTVAVKANTESKLANAAAGGKIRGIVGVAGAVGMAAGIGVAAGEAMDRWGIDPTTSIATGHLTNDMDRERSEEMQKDNSPIAQLTRQASGVSSTKEFKELLDKIDKLQSDLHAERAGLGVADSLSKQAVDSKLKELDALYNHVTAMPIEQIHKNADAKKKKEEDDSAKEAAAQLAEEQKKNEEANAKRAEARAEQRAAHQMQLDNELAVQLATKAAERGEYSPAIAARLSSLNAQAAANPRIDDPKADQKLVASRDKINDAIDSSKESLSKEQERLNLTAWKAQDKAADDLRQKQIDGLKEQDTLLEAQAKKRLAELEASNKNERAIAAERVRIEDEVAARRLALQNQIGSLQNESSLARETRQDLASAEQTTRDHSIAGKRPDDTSRFSLEQTATGTRYIPLAAKGQVLNADVTQRKGYVDDTAHSRLADFAARQVPGALHHSWDSGSLPGPASRPGSSVAGAGAASGNDPAKAAQDTAGKIVSETQKQATVIVTSMGKILAAMQAETKRFEQLAAQVERIKRT